MTQLAARTGISDTYPAPSNATAKAALAAMWDVINEMSQAAEIDLASAATTNIGGQTTRKLRITGTTGITSLGTTYTGPIVLRFSGALTITHHATTLICPGGANLAVEAGDTLIVAPKCTTSGTNDGWIILTHRRASGGAIFAGLVELSDQQLSRAMIKDCGNVFLDKGTVSSGTATLDYTAGSHQRIQNGGAHTIATSNWPPTGNLGEMLLELVNGAAYAITWPSINWVLSDGTTTTTFSANGVTLQAAGTDWVFLWTRNGGTTIYGKIVR
jgi:hypothetical protein